MFLVSKYTAKMINTLNIYKGKFVSYEGEISTVSLYWAIYAFCTSTVFLWGVSSKPSAPLVKTSVGWKIFFKKTFQLNHYAEIYFIAGNATEKPPTHTPRAIILVILTVIIFSLISPKSHQILYVLHKCNFR